MQSPLTVLVLGAAAVFTQWMLTEPAVREITRELLPQVDSTALLADVAAAPAAAVAALAALIAAGGGGDGGPEPGRTPPSAEPDVQPDDIRSRMHPLAPTSPERRCFESLPPWSASSTHGVEIFVESFFRSASDAGASFRYHVVRPAAAPLPTPPHAPSGPLTPATICPTTDPTPLMTPAGG